MAITYEDVNPSLVPNTTMQKGMYNGEHRIYLIAPVDGYVLHDKAWDSPVYDEDGNEIGVILGYESGMSSCGFNYDFVANPREFYAVPASSVPEDQIPGATPSTPPTETL